tara:strand:+ start:11540 stop:12691 length:1152 start_codon:yes stop_codon:yes gene_type:complete
VVIFYKILRYTVIAIICLFIAFIALLAYLFVTQANIKQVNYIEGCESDETFTVYCNYQNPEDLAVLPDGRHILVSEFGAIVPLSPTNVQGNLSLLDTTDGRKKNLEIEMSDNVWGDPECQRDSMVLSPHGIDINERLDGSYQLAIVNHMPTETIELFELRAINDAWSLTWRGCVNAPVHGYFNDVALSSNGSFYVSQMYDKNISLFMLAVLDNTKEDTGYVYHWRRQNGFERLVNTDGAFPNGVELSDDENNLFINYAFGNKTSKYNLMSNSIEASFSMNGIPDNITVDGDYIWVGAQDHSGLDSLIYCGVFAKDVFEDPMINQCPLPFAAYQLRQSDLSLVNSYKYSNTVMGTATVALSLNGQLYIGTYHGDRIASVELSKE